MQSIIKIFFLSAVIFFSAVALANAQDSSKSSNKKHESNMNLPAGKQGMDMKGMKMDMQSTKTKIDSSIVRKGVIDLKAIDKNKDGKVYQDVMDYNVISDKPGKCPICGMTLKKVSLEKAKENLVKAGFKVK